MHATTDALRRRADPEALGSPEHFTRTCRGAAASGRPGVVCYMRVDGWKVPADGAWWVNGIWRPAGEPIDLIPGDRVQYVITQPNPEDDRPRDRVKGRLPDLAAPRVDPVSKGLVSIPQGVLAAARRFGLLIGEGK